MRLARSSARSPFLALGRALSVFAACVPREWHPVAVRPLRALRLVSLHTGTHMLHCVFKLHQFFRKNIYALYLNKYAKKGKRKAAISGG